VQLVLSLQVCAETRWGVNKKTEIRNKVKIKSRRRIGLTNIVAEGFIYREKNY